MLEKLLINTGILPVPTEASLYSSLILKCIERKYLQTMAYIDITESNIPICWKGKQYFVGIEKGTIYYVIHVHSIKGYYIHCYIHDKELCQFVIHNYDEVMASLYDIGNTLKERYDVQQSKKCSEECRVV